MHYLHHVARSSLTALLLLGCAALASAQQPRPVQEPSPPQPPSPAQQVLDESAAAGHYTFLLFYKTEDDATRAMAQTLQEELDSRAAAATAIYVQVGDPAEQAVVDRFNVSRAPMPLTMVIAPNGAITAIFNQELKPELIDDAFVTPTMMRCMKALQEGKLALVLVQGGPQALMPRAVKGLQQDPHFKDRLVTVSFHAQDAAEGMFLGQMEIDPTKVKGVTIALLAPPGVLVGKFPGTASEDEIAAALAKAGKCCDDPNCRHNREQAGSQGQPMPGSRRN